MDDNSKKICFVEQMFFYGFVLFVFDLFVFNNAILIDAVSSSYWNFLCFLLQSDVDNDLIGDSCDTNQDRYAMLWLVTPAGKWTRLALSWSVLLIPREP